MRHIDSYFIFVMEKVSAGSLLTWAILAAVVGVFTYFLWYKGKISGVSAALVPLLIYYLCFTLTITIVGRYLREHSQYHFELFWSYKAILGGKTNLIAENFWNVILFIPIGGMVAGIIRKHPWITILFGFFLSVSIEVLQLLAHRGLFEFDDIFHNTVGTVVGVVLYLLVCRMVRKSSILVERKRF